jgi:hypothetical protein
MSRGTQSSRTTTISREAHGVRRLAGAFEHISITCTRKRRQAWQAGALHTLRVQSSHLIENLRYKCGIAL